jgi:hypothetical protein
MRSQEEFEAEIFPTRLALLFEHASYYTRRMSNEDSRRFFETARLKFWQMQNDIGISAPAPAILRVWVEALKRTAREQRFWSLQYSTCPFRRLVRGPLFARLVMHFKEP